MDWKEFLASLVHALAWPTVVLVVVLLLRQPLARALSSRRLKRIKAGPSGIELELWDETVEEAKEELAAQTKSETIEGAGPVEEDLAGRPFLDEMKALARVSPRAVVLESFSRLEQLLRTDLGVEDRALGRRPLTIRTLGRIAEERQLLGPQEHAVLEDLVPLRNAVAHAQAEELDEERALEFAALVRQLMIAILLAQGKNTDTPGVPNL